MKFVANLLVAIHNVAAAEAMVLAMKAGLDPALMLKVVADGAGGSRMLQVRGPMMVKDDYSEATMKIEVWQKDMTDHRRLRARARLPDAAVRGERADLQRGDGDGPRQARTPARWARCWRDGGR